MGIDFVVVKGNEPSFRDNRTLDELIRNCDVVSINTEPISDKEALKEEADILKFIMMSHADRRATLRARRKMGNFDLKDVFMKTMEKRKPIIYLERYADKEEAKRMIMRRDSIWDAYTSIDLLMGGYPDVLHKIFNNLLRDVKYISQRDSNMVANAYRIHQKIVLLYPRLEKKQQLNYLVVVYRLHRIEEGLRKVPDSNVQAMDLVSPHVPHWWGHEPFMKIAKENASFEECEDILAKAVLNKIYGLAICNAPEHYLLPQLCNAAVSNIGVKELEILNLRINPDASRTEKIEAFRQFFSDMEIEMPRQLRDYRRLCTKMSSNIFVRG